MSNPLDELLSFAHQSFIRLEAEQLIQECLEREDAAPMNTLLEGLVLGGAPSLFLLREVLEEVLNTKSALSQEGFGIRQDLKDALSEFGVNIPQLLSVNAPEAIQRIFDQDFPLHSDHTADAMLAENEALLEEICVEASERVVAIDKRLSLINGIEESIRDWISSLAYEAAHYGVEDSSPSSNSYIH